ncbi:MAG: hypothetical protein HOO90_02585, partial [Methylotenera sp.]|uniref:tyrosine-type recombinase/integrase n=1 Tax=Methylotenera sp. TaxID=2051956 RepID=UPI001851D29F
ELASGVATRGLATYKDYKEVINDYLIACLGKRKITNIDFTALSELEAFRNERMQKTPSRSTMLTHNAALNRVFDEAEIRGYITKINRPTLVATGAKSIRRPAFDIIEVQALLGNFEAWIKRARTPKSRALRFVLSQYVNVLLDTGARPGKELLNLRWKQIKPSIKPEVKHTGQLDEEGEEIVSHNLNRSVVMTVSGKNGEREIVGMLRTVNALKEIGKRNYAVEMSVAYPLKNIVVASNNDLVFTIKNGVKPTSFNALFESYLEEHNLLVDPKTNQNRVLYSLRHTYATLALTHDKVPIHTLAKQMGTSVVMIEKHYSHLDVVKAIEQLRGNESRQLINAGGVIDAFYASKKAP